MVDQLTIRASDRDRQQVVDRLRSALEDGRLTMDEYVDRMEAAYKAATYGDLVPLCADLPASTPVIAGPLTAAGAAAPPAVFSPAGYLAGLPAVLKILWTIWLTAVSVNVVVWALVSGTVVTRPTPGQSGWPVRTGRCCSPCRLASRYSGAADRRSRGRSAFVSGRLLRVRPGFRR